MKAELQQRPDPGDFTRWAGTGALDVIYDAAPLALALLDTSVRYVLVNERLADMNGVPVAEHLGRTVSEVLPVVGGVIETLVRQVIASGEAIVDLYISGPTQAHHGVVRDYCCSWYPVRGEYGAIVGVTAIVVDVTAQRILEHDREIAIREARLARARAEALQRVTALLAGATTDDAVERALAGELSRIAAVDRWTLVMGEAIPPQHTPSRMPSAQVVRIACTDGARTVATIEIECGSETGLSSDELALLDGIAQQCAVTLTRNHLREVERQTEHRERIATTLASTLRLLEDPEAVVLTAVRQLRDLLDARHVVFTEASDAGDTMQLVADATAPDARSMVDDAPFVPIESFGYDAQKFRDGTPLMFADLHAEWQDRGVPEAMVEYTASQGTVAGLWVPLRVDGKLSAALGVLQGTRWVWADAEIQFIQEQGARLMDALMRARATRALKAFSAELEQRVEQRTAELQRANGELAEASVRKGRFVANMSHEIRTPLNAILGFNQLMAEGLMGPLSAQQAECLDDILTSGQHLLRIVDDVLDSARMEAGKVSYRPEAVVLSLFLPDCLAAMRLHAEKSAVTLRTELEVDASIPFYTDPARLRQVLFNYLSNAIKWSSPGGIVTLRVSRRIDGATRFTVTDNGVGIDSSLHGRLFQEFERLSNAVADVPGTGLGLVLVRRIVEAQGGSVGVTSKPGEGSSFWAEFPAHASVA